MATKEMIKELTSAGAAETSDGGVSGVGGWLLMFVVNQCVAILVAVRSLGVLADLVRAVQGFAAQFMVAIIAAVAMGYAAAGVVGLRLIVLRDKDAPRFHVGLLTATGGAGFLGLFLLFLFNPTGSEAGLGQIVRSVLPPMLHAFVWASYWSSSERVRNTFGGSVARPAFPSGN